MLEKGPFDHVRPGCPVAEDPEFRERWMPGETEGLPVPCGTCRSREDRP